jgi:rod shape determining protein RodA
MASITLRPTSDSRNERVGLDWWLLFAAAGLTFIGLLAIFSAGTGVAQVNLKKQVMNIVLGIVPMGIFGLVHPRIWSRFMPVIYGANLLCLMAVLVLGKSSKGAERWINLGPLQLQPSEVCKILIVITLATFYAYRQDRIKELSTFLLGMVHVFVPIFFILIQPHLGASLLIVTLWIALSLVAGVPPKFLAAVIGLFAMVTTLVFAVPTVRNTLLRPYQIQRVEGILGISKGAKDTKGKNYQTQMALYAFGNGGLSGTGYLKGEQKFKVPEQDTDFIISLVGEEFGFLGSMTVLGLFGLLFYRLWLALLNAADFYYQMIIAGILTVLAFHMFVNIGMVLQLLPVVGLWCPFLSRGGTAIWLCMSLVGLALNIRARERVVLF